MVKTPSDLFTVGERPLLAFMPKDDPERDTYVKLIEDNGGIVTSSVPNAKNGVMFISSYPIDGFHPIYRASWVDHSISNGKLADVNPYVFPVKKETGGRKTVKYTQAQDEYILEQIRLKPLERGSHRFFELLEGHEELKGHTKHSLRSRYRRHLVHNLKYVYKVNEHGKLILDEYGNKIKVSPDSYPDLKKRFTPLDDYALCAEVLRFAVSRLSPEEAKFEKNNQDPARSLIPESPHVSRSFFKDVMLRFHRQHSDSSWRDRYRKFAVKCGIKSYFEYYGRCVNEGTTPLVMTTVPLRDTELSVGAKALVGSNYNDDRVNIPLDEEISQTRSSTAGRLSEGAQKKRKVAAIATPVLGLVESDEEEAFFDPESQPEPNATTPAANVSTPAPKADEPTPKKPKVQASPEPGSEEVEEDEEDSQVGFEYLADPMMVYDLFEEEFFQESSDTMKSKLDTVYAEVKSQPLAFLMQKLKELHFKSGFVNHIIRSTGGVHARIKKYNDIWVSRLLNDPAFIEDGNSLLDMTGQVGIWTRLYDNELKKEKLLGVDSAEIKFQPKKEKTKRVAFLKSIGVW
ncbi:DNA-binding transcription factor rap1 [Yamadazyma tenuis]|uniref:DNA-binding protein RAP1 n=1 Tax=Candida tenuis (strain ATCC 10573 / BCRC 21748 / CBS 615 / JCM 9827 / NBRC 10315 / NRRL Y-1498 / VKM Y-70) TaxID=590646 RepID=G3AXS9_CANTC|nr:uncharacterized protein CANTEDRAFT_133093 [Yamadazyma tenuis ATCC 10573]EGV65688.1 hypothetical protein CANTEDRAFT_133093 [Yamadazyma tenuis ATCC 10573]WEJ95999.1 DNA-binding transcription factor rap1 [Yamadazyma tenuis]